ncbi:helix-hairpin-helix domain-containing protein [Cryobacterium lactosi]|uniref:Helix-hairpin-helix domain-containing protein n=2 Tax=Cryobacterium lactosi TaxID=1259202 RepID=A0A4R9BWJ0_9MICO|nr:helix-hairpin-helix domain-containing protein [Cryobacterium lactosi]
MRIGVGAALVLLLVALGIAVTVTAVGQVGHNVEVAANSGSTDTALTDTGSSDTGSTDTGTSAPSPDTAGASGEAAGAAEVDAAGAGGTGTSAVFVHVLGAVAHPGLFEVRQGARVVDVVAAAGGLLATADQAGVNLARLVSDGEQIYVPELGEVVAGPAAAGAGAGASGGGAEGAAARINLNTATIADLDTLPRIGATMAQRIVDYRDAQGRFTSIEDLRNVTGIGDKTFAALQDLITV